MLLPLASTLAYSSLQCPRRSRSYFLLRRPSNERLTSCRLLSPFDTSPSCCLRRFALGLSLVLASPRCRLAIGYQRLGASYCLVPFRSSSWFFPRRILSHLALCIWIGQFPPWHSAFGSTQSSALCALQYAVAWVLQLPLCHCAFRSTLAMRACAPLSQQAC